MLGFPNYNHRLSFPQDAAITVIQPANQAVAACLMQSFSTLQSG